MEATSQLPPDSAPECYRFRRARMVTLLTVMSFYLFYRTGRQTFGFAIPGMRQEFGPTRSQLGWCRALMLWSYAIGQAINGQLPDRLGGRSMMTAGGIRSVIFNWIVSLSTGLASITSPWAANGLAQSMGRPPDSRILSDGWDRRHRGVVYGSYIFAAGCASIPAFVMATWVVDFSAKLVAGLGEPMVGALVDRSGRTSVIFAVVAAPFTLTAGLMAAVKHQYYPP